MSSQQLDSARRRMEIVSCEPSFFDGGCEVTRHSSCSANGTQPAAHVSGDGEASNGTGRVTSTRRLVVSSQRLGSTRKRIKIVPCESSFVDGGCKTTRHFSCSASGTRPAAHARGDGEASNSSTGVSDTSPAVCRVELAARFGTQTHGNRLVRAVVR